MKVTMLHESQPIIPPEERKPKMADFREVRKNFEEPLVFNLSETNVGDLELDPKIEAQIMQVVEAAMSHIVESIRAEGDQLPGIADALSEMSEGDRETVVHETANRVTSYFPLTQLVNKKLSELLISSGRSGEIDVTSLFTSQSERVDITKVLGISVAGTFPAQSFFSLPKQLFWMQPQPDWLGLNSDMASAHSSAERNIVYITDGRLVEQRDQELPVPDMTLKKRILSFFSGRNTKNVEQSGYEGATWVAEITEITEAWLVDSLGGKNIQIQLFLAE